jgi:S1-C subfamily serine protease
VPGVIRIRTATCSGSYIGTGFLITPRLVVTVDHVVAGATAITFTRDGTTLGTGTVIGSDPVRDVALVRTDSPITGYQFHFSSEAPELGEDVTAIGFPFDLPLTVTSGSISGLGRTVPIDGIERSQMIQTDAPVNPGNSGGPLITDSGAVIGLVDLGTDQANGLAFAVSAATAQPLVQGWAAAPQPVPLTSCVPLPPATTIPPPVQTVPPPATTVPPPATSVPSPVYHGHDFSIHYPPSWVVIHFHEGGGNLDTTFQPPGAGGVLIKVDEQPVDNQSLAASVAPVMAALEKQPTYRRISLTPTSFDGVPCLRWEFEVTEEGIPLHKVDTLFKDAYGHGWAVLFQSPEAVWGQDSGWLQSYADTFSD